MRPIAEREGARTLANGAIAWITAGAEVLGYALDGPATDSPVPIG